MPISVQWGAKKPAADADEFMRAATSAASILSEEPHAWNAMSASERIELFLRAAGDAAKQDDVKIDVFELEKLPVEIIVQIMRVWTHAQRNRVRDASRNIGHALFGMHGEPAEGWEPRWRPRADLFRALFRDEYGLSAKADECSGVAKWQREMKANHFKNTFPLDAKVPSGKGTYFNDERMVRKMRKVFDVLEKRIFPVVGQDTPIIIIDGVLFLFYTGDLDILQDRTVECFVAPALSALVFPSANPGATTVDDVIMDRIETYGPTLTADSKLPLPLTRSSGLAASIEDGSRFSVAAVEFDELGAFSISTLPEQPNVPDIRFALLEGSERGVREVEPISNETRDAIRRSVGSRLLFSRKVVELRSSLPTRRIFRVLTNEEEPAFFASVIVYVDNSSPADPLDGTVTFVVPENRISLSSIASAAVYTPTTSDNIVMGTRKIWFKDARNPLTADDSDVLSLDLPRWFYSREPKADVFSLSEPDGPFECVCILQAARNNWSAKDRRAALASEELFIDVYRIKRAKGGQFSVRHYNIPVAFYFQQSVTQLSPTSIVIDGLDITKYATILDFRRNTVTHIRGVRTHLGDHISRTDGIPAYGRAEASVFDLEDFSWQKRQDPVTAFLVAQNHD